PWLGVHPKSPLATDVLAWNATNGLLELLIGTVLKNPTNVAPVLLGIPADAGIGAACWSCATTPIGTCCWPTIDPVGTSPAKTPSKCPSLTVARNAICPSRGLSARATLSSNTE